MRQYVSAAIAASLMVLVISGNGLAEHQMCGAGHGGGRGHDHYDPHPGHSSPGDGNACRELQREVQNAIIGATSREEVARALKSVLRSAPKSTSPQCESCIVREVLKIPLPRAQAPCGAHDVCVVGDPLDPASDACIADVCAARGSCCRKRWDQACVDLTAGVCALDCTACEHDACSEGRALPQTCGECAMLVCGSDPYCCDTSWDASCVEAALATCSSPCSMTPTTTLPPPTSTTTVAAPTTTVTTATITTTTSTLPRCRSAYDCADGDACTTNTCTSGACTSSPVACDDRNACTADACDSVSGCRATPVSCDDGDACTTDSCNTATGCIHTVIAGCVPCSSPSQCDDGKPCTNDVCTVAGTCSHPNNTAACDDGNLCTVGDHCLNGSCIGGPIMSCNDGNACTVDACSAGQCTHSTLTCSDGNACTTDTCDAVTGCAHQTVSCDDANACTADTCNFVQGCRHTPIGGCTP